MDLGAICWGGLAELGQVMRVNQRMLVQLLGELNADFLDVYAGGF